MTDRERKSTEQLREKIETLEAQVKDLENGFGGAIDFALKRNDEQDSDLKAAFADIVTDREQVKTLEAQVRDLQIGLLNITKVVEEIVTVLNKIAK